MNVRLSTITFSLCCAGIVSACSLDCRMDKDPLETAALYGKPEGRPYSLPLDTWTRNPGLEAFLRQVVKGGGISALVAKYEMRCTPSPPETGCSECFVCSRTIRDWRLGMAQPPIPIYVEILKCVDYGETLIHAEIGPGLNVNAMTYWKTTPEVPKQ